MDAAKMPAKSRPTRIPRVEPDAAIMKLAAVAPADKKVRSQVLRTAQQTLSVLVQTGLAELLLSAEPGRGVPAPAAAAA